MLPGTQPVSYTRHYVSPPAQVLNGQVSACEQGEDTVPPRGRYTRYDYPALPPPYDGVMSAFAQARDQPIQAALWAADDERIRDVALQER